MNGNTGYTGVALVTGAGRRVGRAIALGLSEAGYEIAVHYNGSEKGALEVVARIKDAGRRGVTIRHNLTDAQSAGDLINQTASRLGPVNILINSASLFDEDNLETLSFESWHRLISVNLAAPVFLMQAFAQQTPTPENSAIINILDTQMTSVYPERFSYFCAKFGLEGATKLAAFDLARKCITVNAIAPGLILPSGQTVEEFSQRQQLTPLGEGLGTDDIVSAVRYLISARQVTGHTLVVDAGQRLMGMGNMGIPQH